jgi:hypothetical protein
MNFESPKIPSEKFPEKKLSEDYWFKIGEKIYKESGEIPDPLELRARAIIMAAGIPSGPWSAIEVDPKTKERVNPKRDKIIAEYLTNQPGVEIEKGVVSRDFRDIYPEGLPKKLEKVLPKEVREIMNVEYQTRKDILEILGQPDDVKKEDIKKVLSAAKKADFRFEEKEIKTAKEKLRQKKETIKKREEELKKQEEELLSMLNQFGEKEINQKKGKFRKKKLELSEEKLTSEMEEFQKLEKKLNKLKEKFPTKDLELKINVFLLNKRELLFRKIELAVVESYIENKEKELDDNKLSFEIFKRLIEENDVVKYIPEKDVPLVNEILKKHLTEYRNYKFDNTVNYFRLPGGIDLFMKGYQHTPGWQKVHGKYLKKINKQATIIAIEGFADVPFGKSLDIYWSSKEKQRGDYDKLMREAVEAGFNGLFTEIDARDVSKINMDFISKLPSKFFKDYFSFLQKEHPSLAEKIGSAEKLENILKLLSLREGGIWERTKIIDKKGVRYTSSPYLSQKEETSFEPTFLELGQSLFTDALAAIKLHLIAKLMVDGHLPKGPIVDYQGAVHLSSKSFFLQYPEYAMLVVLRCINELMAGKVGKEEDLSEIYKVFQKPNWVEVTKEIFKLVFKKPEPQGKLLDYPIDYKIDFEKIIPSDEEIEKIRKKLSEIYHK